MNFESVLQSWSPRLLSILRIVVGFLFLQHGTAKLLQAPHIQMFDNLQIGTLLGASGILEIVGGPLIMIGLFTRPVAFILSGMMAVGYFMMHAPQAPLPILNQGELAVVYCFLFLYLAAAGGGPWSVDALRGRAI